MTGKEAGAPLTPPTPSSWARPRIQSQTAPSSATLDPSFRCDDGGGGRHAAHHPTPSSWARPGIQSQAAPSSAILNPSLRWDDGGGGRRGAHHPTPSSWARPRIQSQAVPSSATLDPSLRWDDGRRQANDRRWQAKPGPRLHCSNLSLSPTSERRAQSQREHPAEIIPVDEHLRAVVEGLPFLEPRARQVARLGLELPAAAD